ncbi:Hypothetical protein P9303_26761 [Prochlorococcus marinus str. MIT 9303]|uniref:Uncharacterized protein n=1 Tax=Prochlorococcus marinus (strain MIT 9303) TaxID=59922 RepID=A2CD46_PROM3|nr:Hypothetical protein P9303_26761 [Prochlorococcus marinus str. MIT 9303]
MQVELDYQIADGLTAGINVSYDEAFETRVSGNIEYRFGSNSTAAETKKKAWQKPTIQALSESVKNRNIRVHDGADPDAKCKIFDPRNGHFVGSMSVTNTATVTDWIAAEIKKTEVHCNPGAPKATAGGWEPYGESV